MKQIILNTMQREMTTHAKLTERKSTENTKPSILGLSLKESFLPPLQQNKDVTIEKYKKEEFNIFKRLLRSGVTSWEDIVDELEERREHITGT